MLIFYSSAKIPANFFTDSSHSEYYNYVQASCPIHIINKREAKLMYDIYNPPGCTPADCYCMPDRCCRSPYPVTFEFYAIDSETGAGLPCALFALSSHDRIMAAAVSDCRGVVCFPSICPGSYTLFQPTPPLGYQPNAQTFMVEIYCCGCISIDGESAYGFRVSNTRITEPLASFTAYKYDVQSGRRLSGAVFRLYSGATALGNAISVKDGSFTFSNLPPGAYTLTEVQAPNGYVASSDSHAVLVNQDGFVTIDGFPAVNTAIGNRPLSSGVSLTDEEISIDDVPMNQLSQS